MPFAYRDGAAWREITGPFTIADEEAGIQRPVDWPELATADELQEAGVAEIVEPISADAWLLVIGSDLIDVDGLPHRIWITEPFDLEVFRARQLTSMNAAAGAVRARYITDIAGQQATYLAKEQEAKGWSSGADPSEFPYLAHEAEATSKTIDQVAALVLTTAETWRALDPKIEGRRRGACVAIEQAASPQEIAAAAAVDWDAVLTA